MATLDEILDRLTDEAVLTDEQAAEIREGAAPARFREKMKQFKKEISEGRMAREELARIEGLPNVRAAFENQGVDWKALKPLEREHIERFADYGDEDRVRAFIESKRLPTVRTQ